MKKIFLFLSCILFSAVVFVQVSKDSATKTFIDSINRVIDRAVVKNKWYCCRNIMQMILYSAWNWPCGLKTKRLKDVRDTSVHYLSREHDSTLVELHKDVAIISGTLTVKRQRPEGVTAYALRYVRVFALRPKEWQISLIELRWSGICKEYGAGS